MMRELSKRDSYLVIAPWTDLTNDHKTSLADMIIYDVHHEGTYIWVVIAMLSSGPFDSNPVYAKIWIGHIGQAYHVPTCLSSDLTL